MSDPCIPARPAPDPDPFALDRHRGRWDIQAGRDGIAIWSALRRPTPSSVVYLVAHTPAELAAMIDRWEADSR